MWMELSGTTAVAGSLAAAALTRRSRFFFAFVKIEFAANFNHVDAGD
jgi:hypothetical protein